MTTIYLILLVLAAACFLAFAFRPNLPNTKVSLLGLGLFLWVLVPLIQTAKVL